MARRLLGPAKRIAALTGAGISAESGIPTFRGPEGLWQKIRPEEIATPEAFRRDPKLVWEWYESRRQLVAKAEPNPGHRALAALERDREVTVITQNIDGLHQKAGSKRVIEFHGSIWRVRCTGCGRERERREVPLRELPPRCSCGRIERPGVVLFGDPIPPEVMQDSAAAVSQSDVMMIVGTSMQVYPAAGLAEVAAERQVPVVEVNVEPSDARLYVSVFVRGKAGEVLPRLLDGLSSKPPP